MNANPMDNYLKLQKIGKGSGECKVYQMKNLSTGQVR